MRDERRYNWVGIYRKPVIFLEGGMNIRIKRAMLAAGIVTTMALPLTGQASDGTITFTGAVTASTCTLSVNGGVNAGTATVALPTVDIGGTFRHGGRNDRGGNLLQCRCDWLPRRDGYR